jgi:UDP-N-acetylmuramoylalanine--D-glutamate ligase
LILSTSDQRGGAGLPPSMKTALVLGASRSGLAAAAALARLGLKVTLSDRKALEALSGLDEARSLDIAFVGQEELVAGWPRVDLVIKSPGVPAEARPVAMAREKGVPVWSEVELAYALFPNPFDAVTGTNGKTTTTSLLGHLFLTAGRPVRILGNIGTAVTSVAGAIAFDEELVVEVSSFQLEDVHAFRPAVGIFLNLTPDHLDRHGSMRRYLECKANLFANQGPEDVAVLSLDDPAVAQLGEELCVRSAGPRVAYFSTAPVGSDDRHGSTSSGGSRAHSWVADGWIILEGQRALAVDEIQIPGRHNLENCLAAGTAALARGVDICAVAEGLRSFAGVEHRLERAGIVAGVTYVNDSKATNVEATLTALSAYPQDTHLILGGRDKASDYRPIARACARGCRAVYLIGEATPLIADAFREVTMDEDIAGVPEPRSHGDLETAVKAAARAARAGEVVLLAPACASFDQYGSFEERGEHFRRIVADLGREIA